MAARARTIDWFRRTDWTPEVEADFDARLARARVANRPQYLRIQALHLVQAGGELRLRKALELIDRFMSAPTDFDLAPAYDVRAKAHAKLGEDDAAFEAYRMSCEARRRKRTMGTDAYLEFGFLAIVRRRDDLYDEAVRLLDEFGGQGSAPFPMQQYKHYAIRAVASEALGDRSMARTQANLALEAAAKTNSGLPYHAGLGLVGHPDTSLHVMLVRLARAT